MDPSHGHSPPSRPSSAALKSPPPAWWWWCWVGGCGCGWWGGAESGGAGDAAGAAGGAASGALVGGGGDAGRAGDVTGVMGTRDGGQGTRRGARNRGRRVPISGPEKLHKCSVSGAGEERRPARNMFWCGPGPRTGIGAGGAQGLALPSRAIRRAVEKRPPGMQRATRGVSICRGPGAERGKSGPARDCGGLPARGPRGGPGSRAQRRLVPQRGRRARDSRLTCGWSPQRLLILLCIGADAREGGRQPHPQDESERNGMRAMDECEDAGARAAPQPHPQPRLPCLCLPRGLAPPAPAPLFACLARVALSPSSPLPRQREPRRLGGVGRV